MVTMDQVREAVDKAKEMLEDCGINLDITEDQLWDWFQTDLPIPDIDLGEVILDPLLVVHELVEIDEVLKMGLAITKDVIIKNPEKVDDAHIKAAKVEFMVAESVMAIDHLRDRILDVEKWSVDNTVGERRRAEYRQLLSEARDALERMTREPRPST